MTLTDTILSNYKISGHLEHFENEIIFCIGLKQFSDWFLIFYNSVESYEDNVKEKNVDKIINEEEDFLDIDDAKGGLISGGIFNSVLFSKHSLVYHA